jgi:putative RNA 2'-phosphotransferase
MSVRASKFLSLVLRHDPGRIGITLDDAGWTDVAALLAACAAHGVPITRDELAAIVATSDKRRFAFSPDGARIRASQGHSVDVDLQLAPAIPPDTLFHGTVERALDGIRAAGLLPGERHHVHLSADRDTASLVGARRGRPVILTIRAGAMAAAGHTFYQSANGVWLVDHVPPAFIVEGARPEGMLDQMQRIAVAESTLAAIDAGRYVNRRHEIVLIADAVEAAASGTVLYELGAPLDPPAAGPPTQIEVTGESTIAALLRLRARGGHLACLNFASAKNPGGGFLNGAQAQEESLARSSALHRCLLAQPTHYQRNRSHGSLHYLDLAMFSPRVPFLRDDRGGWLDRPLLASVVTCAAPNAGALRQHGQFKAAAVELTLRRRAGLVLAIAAHHRVERLVLGAWGAGVFGNDPAIVADAFGALLDGAFANAFAEVVFAIHGGAGANHDAFARRFAPRP